MRAIIEARELEQAVKTAGKAAGRSKHLPILDGVRLTAAAGELTIGGTDLTTWSTARAAGVVEIGAGPDSVIVSASILGKIAGKLSGLVHLESGEGILTIYAGETKADIDTLCVDDFPEQGGTAGAVHLCDLTGAQFKAMAARAKSCARAQKHGGRAFLSSISLLYGEGLARFVTSDGFHLLVEEYPADVQEAGVVMVEAAAVQRIAGLAKAADVVRLDVLQADTDPRVNERARLVISFRSSTFTVRGIDEQPFDFERIIPRATWPQATELTVDRARLLAMVERASIVANPERGAVMLTIDGGGLMGSSSSLDRGAFCETLTADVKLQDDGRDLFDISFPCSILGEMLKGTKAMTASLTFTESLKPARLRFDDAPALSWVVMPVKA